MPRRDLLSILEAAYALDRGDDEWLAGLAESVRVNVPFRTIGVVANGYDVSNPTRARLDHGGVQLAGDVARLAHCAKHLQSFYERDPGRIRASYATLDEGLGLEIPVEGRERLAAELRKLKMGDVYAINGRNPSGHGVLIGMYLPAGHPEIPDTTRRTFARIARHIAAAYRLRRRIARARESARSLKRIDAMLTRDGTVAHAAGAARPCEMRVRLQHAALALVDARGRKRFQEPDHAIEKWKTLVDARWSLVDHFERDGSYYLVAQRNDCQPAPMALLTHRERQVVALVKMGYSNKAVAYELGLATSTVGVLVSRALGRLGLRTRRELRLTKP